MRCACSRQSSTRRAHVSPSCTVRVAARMTMRWRGRTPSAFASDVLRRRQMDDGAMAEDLLTASNAVSPGAAQQRAPRRKPSLFNRMPVRIVKHQLLILPFRRCKALLERTWMWQLAAWWTLTWIGVLEHVLHIKIV